MKYLITYDIEDDKKRKKISDEKLEELVDEKHDSLRFYHICENCVPKSFELCGKSEIFQKEDFYI